MSKITNTTKDDAHPEWLMGGNPNAIERQEAQGQQELVNSTQLPVTVRGDKELLEREGVKFGKPLTNDPLFCDAELPDGWSKRPTDHSMWSEIVNDKGEVIASIFYKAAFYDRDAFIQVK